MKIITFIIGILALTSQVWGRVIPRHRRSRHSRYPRYLSGNPIVPTMNLWSNPSMNPYFGQKLPNYGSMNQPEEPVKGEATPQQNMTPQNLNSGFPANPMMMHPSMSGMMSPFMSNSMMPQNNPYMLGLYGSYHPGNILHPLHPFSPYNSYAGMAFNPMMTGPYGFGGATYMDSYIDGPVDDKRKMV